MRALTLKVKCIDKLVTKILVTICHQNVTIETDN